MRNVTLTKFKKDTLFAESSHFKYYKICDISFGIIRNMYQINVLCIYLPSSHLNLASIEYF